MAAKLKSDAIRTRRGINPSRVVRRVRGAPMFRGLDARLARHGAIPNGFPVWRCGAGDRKFLSKRVTPDVAFR